jgi:hypothetical protein
MFLSGVQSGFRLDSRLKHAGMTDFGWGIYLTQQAAGNRPTEIEPNQSDNDLNEAAAVERFERLERRVIRP